MGLLGTLLAAKHCDGTPSFLKQEQIPSATHVDSRDAGADKGKSRTYSGTADSNPVRVQAGREEAWAYNQPRGKSKMTLATASLPGVIDAQGGLAQTETGIVDGATRVASGSVDLGDLALFGGVIKLSHLRWNAVQQTGKDAKAQGTFSIGSAELGGQSIPTDAPAQTLAAINQLTSQIGVTLLPPSVTQDNGVVKVSPLVLHMQTSPSEQTVTSPLLVALQPARQQVTAALTKITCYFQTIITVADVSAGPLTGSGAFELGFGGTAVTTDGTRYDNPFGGLGGGGADVLGSGLTAPTPGSASSPSFRGGSFGSAPTGLAAGPSTSAANGKHHGQAAGGILAGARSLPGHTGGWSILVGLLAVAGVIGVAGADWRRVRRGEQ
jgi:hypothetical protein